MEDDVAITVNASSYERGMLDGLNLATKALIRYQKLYPTGTLEHRLLNTLRLEMEAQRQNYGLDVVAFMISKEIDNDDSRDI